MLLVPTDDPGSEMTMGFTGGWRSLFTDGGSLFTEEDEMLPPYRGAALALDCMDIRLESSDITRAEGLSCW